MSTRAALCTGIRLVAVVLGVRAIVYVPSLVLTLLTFAGREDQWPYHLSLGLAFTLSVAAALLLFKYADRVAGAVVSSDERIETRDWHDPSVQRGIFQLAVRIIGAACVAWAVPRMAGQASRGLIYYSEQWYYVTHEVLPGLVGLAVGVYLLKGGGILVRLAYGPEVPGQDTAQ